VLLSGRFSNFEYLVFVIKSTGICNLNSWIKLSVYWSFLVKDDIKWSGQLDSIRILAKEEVWLWQ
jgi:hypothetical protein